MEQKKPLFLESGLNWLTAKAKEYKVPLLASFLFGMLAYGFTFTNKLVNHDDVRCLFAKGGALSSGRWGLNILERIFPNYSMPFIYGVITLAFIAVSICLIIHIFNIKRNLLQVLLAGGIVLFPSLIGTFGYMFTSSSFGLSFLMAVLAVMLIQRPTKRHVIPALICMVFSLSIYQSYISLAAGLLVLILIQQLLEDAQVKDVLRQGVTYLLFLILSLAVYYVTTKLLQRILNVGFNGYAAENMNFSFSDLPSKIGVAYSYFFRFFREGYQSLIPTVLSRMAHWVVLAAIVLLLLLNGLQKRKDLPRLLLLALLVGILPLAINCMYLFTTEKSVHTLVLYGFISFYVLAAILADLTVPADLLHRSALEAITLTMTVIVISNIYVANEASLNLYLRYENAYAFYTSLAADIKMMPDFNETTKLAVVGNYENPYYYHEKFPHISALTGTAGFFPDSYSKADFVEYYLGFPIPFASDEEAAAIAATKDYADMPVYPYYGSMKFFDDILVVKLS